MIVMNENSGQIAALAAALCWTISSICWTTAGRHVGSLVVNTVRLVLAMGMFILYGLIFRGEALPFSASLTAWLWLSLSGIFGFFLSDLFLFRSFLLIGPRHSLLIASLAPIISTGCAWLWLDERLEPRAMLGILIALAGVAWVILEAPGTRDSSRKRERRSAAGIALAFLAMLTQGVAIVLSKIGLMHFGDPVAATAIRVIAGLTCFIILVTATGRVRACVEAFTRTKPMLIITVGTIAGPTTGVALLMFALTRIPSGLAATLVSMTPIMIIPFSILLFKEKVSLRSVIGVIVAVAGLAILLH